MSWPLSSKENKKMGIEKSLSDDSLHVKVNIVNREIFVVKVIITFGQNGLCEN